jgi:hypothetical protein
MHDNGVIVMNGRLDTSALYDHRQNRPDVRSNACMNIDCSDRAEHARRLTVASVFNMYRASMCSGGCRSVLADEESHDESHEGHRSSSHDESVQNKN